MLHKFISKGAQFHSVARGKWQSDDARTPSTPVSINKVPLDAVM